MNVWHGFDTCPCLCGLAAAVFLVAFQWLQRLNAAICGAHFHGKR